MSRSAPAAGSGGKQLKVFERWLSLWAALATVVGVLVEVPGSSGYFGGERMK